MIGRMPWISQESPVIFEKINPLIVKKMEFSKNVKRLPFLIIDYVPIIDKSILRLGLMSKSATLCVKHSYWTLCPAYIFHNNLRKMSVISIRYISHVSVISHHQFSYSPLESNRHLTK